MYKVIIYSNDERHIFKNVSMILVHDDKLILCAGVTKINLSFPMDIIKRIEVKTYDNSI